MEKESELSRSDTVVGKQDNSTKEKGSDDVKVPVYQPCIPYLAKVKKDHHEEQYKKFLDLFKTLHINVPFVKVLAQMPRYA